MICTPEIREVIRNRNRAGELHGMLESGQDDHQTQTFDQHLKQLVQEKTISVETATATATDPSIFEPAPPKRRRSKKGGTS
jgi:Tfp pilus assembly pilus retraction ATPase PilT